MIAFSYHHRNAPRRFPSSAEVKPHQAGALLISEAWNIGLLLARRQPVNRANAKFAVCRVSCLTQLTLAVLRNAHYVVDMRAVLHSEAVDFRAVSAYLVCKFIYGHAFARSAGPFAFLVQERVVTVRRIIAHCTVYIHASIVC